MGRRAYPRLLVLAVLAAALTGLPPTAPAANADFCVTCKDPDQTYRCRVKGVSARASDALKLYCVIRTAKEGNHASCAADKATTGCNGLVKIYTYNGPALPANLTADPRARQLKQRIDQDQRAFDNSNDDDATSLFELGGRAVSASRKGLRSAGTAIGLTSSDDATANAEPQPILPPAEPVVTASVPESNDGVGTRMKNAAQNASSAVGGFARKSYRCVLSLFSECSEESGALE